MTINTIFFSRITSETISDLIAEIGTTEVSASQSRFQQFDGIWNAESQKDTDDTEDWTTVFFKNKVSFFCLYHFGVVL